MEWIYQLNLGTTKANKLLHLQFMYMEFVAPDITAC